MYGMSLKMSLLMPSRLIVFHSHREMGWAAGSTIGQAGGAWATELETDPVLIEMFVWRFGRSCHQFCLETSRVSIALGVRNGRLERSRA